jgi:hypothetical protein
MNQWMSRKRTGQKHSIFWAGALFILGLASLGILAAGSMGQAANGRQEPLAAPPLYLGVDS